MKFWKKNDLLKIINDLIVDLAAPINLNYFWNLGSLLGITLIIQLLTGIFLVMHYLPSIDRAFLSVEHLIRDVNNGWFLRYLRANGAGFFFILVYLRIGKALYYGSYTFPRVRLWFSGILIYLILTLTAFLGYVLVWGSMSFWAATVITNFLTAIPIYGVDLVKWIWGGFSVSNPTLNRFLSLRYLFPFLLTALVIIHLTLLHQFGSNNPQGINSNSDKIWFHPYFTIKDIYGLMIFLFFLLFFVFFNPDLLGHPDNYVKANSLVTPASIVPEFYLLFAYAILKSIPSKLGGIIALVMAILILAITPFARTSKIRSNRFKPLSRKIFWLFIGNFFLLTYLGGLRAEDPYVIVTQVSTFFYFGFFILILPPVGLLENKAFNLEINSLLKKIRGFFNLN